ncbi:hypothetical protein KBD49_15545 [Myxococcota bacterium]|nr:hypothetical protein [Myxococcota bacterium]
MKTPWHRIWGSGKGPAGRLCPPARLAAGVLVLGACIASPVPSTPGILWTLSVTVAWVAACRPPGRLVAGGVLLGLVLFLPYFLLVPWIREDGGIRPALEVPASLLIRGTSGIVVCGAIIASLGASDLREALVRLPVPGIVTSILLQIVHQSATLGSETRAMVEAWTVRGATGRRGIGGFALVQALPRVWLPRVAARAERVGEAMAVRGYGEDDPSPLRACPCGWRDGLAIGMAVLSLAVSLMIRGAG